MASGVHKEDVESRRLWAATMLARNVYVAESICAGRPVLVRQLEPAALARALRGEVAPPGDVYMVITGEMLDAVAEGGRFA